MKTLLIIALIASVTACAELNSLRQGIGMYGQKASDNALHDAIWVICNATPVGAIKRKFNTPELLKVYSDFCPDNAEIEAL